MDPDDDVAPDHYFSPRPASASQPKERRFLYKGQILTFVVDRGVFGSHGLDPGTALLIEALDVRPTDEVLDLGCGWGAVGIAAAKSAAQGQVVMTDVNRRAVYLSRGNARRNGITNVTVRSGKLFDPVGETRFDVVATNPPYHAGRPLVLELLAQVPVHLKPGGRFLIVGKGSQGIKFYQEWMEQAWGSVEVRCRGSGYRVLEARPETRPDARQT
ncbi:MAG: methyltransferase [Thermoplasmata archaeon]|nr:methyltransferase [Thermoplasmata archaeon]